MNCPVCQIALRQKQLEEQYQFEALDVCRQCEGIWFDKGELDRLDGTIWVNVEEHSFREVQKHTGRKRPKCNVTLTPLSPAEGSELEIERCPSCEGFRLDGNELEHVRAIADRLHNDLEVKAGRGETVKPGTWAQICLAARSLTGRK